MIQIKLENGSTFECASVEDAVQILTAVKEPIAEKSDKKDRMWRGKVYGRVQDMKTARTRSLHQYTARTHFAGFHPLNRVLHRDPTRLELADYYNIPAEERWVLTAADRWVPLIPEIMFHD